MVRRMLICKMADWEMWWMGSPGISAQGTSFYDQGRLHSQNYLIRQSAFYLFSDALMLVPKASETYRIPLKHADK